MRSTHRYALHFHVMNPCLSGFSASISSVSRIPSFISIFVFHLNEIFVYEREVILYV